MDKDPLQCTDHAGDTGLSAKDHIGEIDMKKERMAICDNDEKYVYRLQELLEQRSSFPFEISVFTGEDKLPEDVRGEKYRLILAGETFYEKMMEKGIREEQLLLLKSSEKCRR